MDARVCKKTGHLAKLWKAPLAPAVQHLKRGMCAGASAASVCARQAPLRWGNGLASLTAATSLAHGWRRKGPDRGPVSPLCGSHLWGLEKVGIRQLSHAQRVLVWWERAS